VSTRSEGEFPRDVRDGLRRVAQEAFAQARPQDKTPNTADDNGALKPPIDQRASADFAKYLFGGFVGLAVITICTPLRTTSSLLSVHMMMLLPFLTFQDLFLTGLLAWIFFGLFQLAKRPWTRASVAAGGWITCLALASYSYLSSILYLIIRRPLTIGLLVAADNLKGIQSSLEAIVTPQLIAALAMAPVYTLFIAMVLARLAPRLLSRLYRGFYSTIGIAFSVLFLVVGHAWAVRHAPYSLQMFNPQWSFVSSAFEQHTPTVTDPIPAGYLDDFRPVARASAAKLRSKTAATEGVSGKPLSVLMVVLESVGARDLHLYGAPFEDTPNLDELAKHAMVFTQAYVAEAETSAAMGALFASVFPDHDWPSLTQIAPSLTVPGLPAVLSRHGYRSAFIHHGQVAFDRQGEFLQSRGFDKIFAEPRDYDSPRDIEMLEKVRSWLKADPARPFFLVVWTQNTHHPYVTLFHHHYAVRDPNFNRYLNGVYGADDLVKQIATILNELGLADHTLLVVTGDHGEAFGEHGQLIHGGTVYNEEVQVPLLIVNPKLFPHEVTVNRIVRQIDIAPTLLALLGYGPAPQWQGADVLGADPPVRAYLFAGTGNFSFGLIEGDFKYIYDFQRDRAQLYNLSTDPGETRNLASENAYATLTRRAHLRLEAWVSFQNRYLAQFENPRERNW